MDFPGQGSLDRLVTVAGEQAGKVKLNRTLREATAKPAIQSASDQKALEESAQEFEGVFLNTLLKAMRQTVPENELFNSGGATKFYRQMHDAEIAKSLATGQAGMGIAEMIVRQLSPSSDESTSSGVTSGPVQGPPSPKALSRYREMIPLAPATVARKRLAALAAQQGPAVADTLQRYEQDIENAAWRSGLDPALILAVVMEESGGDPQARSNKGALGLMQLMPATARELGVKDRSDAAQNLHGGSRYLAEMLTVFEGRLEVALAAYNAGPGTVGRLGGKVPAYPATRRYVDRVLKRYEQLGGGTHLASTRP